MFKTNSLNLAAYLQTTGEVKFVGVNKDNPTNVEFHFQPEDKAKELETKLYAGDATVNASELFKNMRMLKDMLFDAKRNSL